MRPIIPLLLAALAVSATSFARGAPATQPMTKPTAAVAPDTCVNCHADVKNYKVVHGPVNVNACDACHKLVDPAQHKYELARDTTQTCTFCHQIDTHGDAVVHKPVTEGQCLSCHNPHGGATGKFVRGNTVREMCNTCHADVTADKSHIHGPVAAGACSSCHQAHSSKNLKLLVATGRDLCFTCHTEMRNQMKTVKFTHKAVEQDCVTCHDPHASNFVMQTRQPPLLLCTSCHEHDKIRQAAMEASHKHSPVVTEQACLNCHTAHGGDLAKLMRNEPIKVCMKCHEQPIDAKDGRKIASVAQVLDPNMNKHGPIRDGNCAGCHNTHGSDQAKLLVKAYPEPFYQGFAVEKYDLCFSCHDKQLVLTEKTTGLTGFRNGTRNLHFVHVNKVERGRNCRACHETHASAQPLHVRDSVPYGNWNMPINFKRTETGGSCASGCHKPYAYDRNNPVPIAPPSTTQPAPAVASEGKEKQP
jgi:predicted CXXCH cytochrome family protein